jgi:methyltransferase-like protein 6
VPSSRFLAFVADPSASTPARFAAELAAAAHAAGWSTPVTHVDAVLAVFVLSAVPPRRLGVMLASIASCLCPGGALLVRDYGLHDLPMLRFPHSAARGDTGRLFARQDGTLARFFERGELVQEVCAGAAGAGVALACDEAEWCCVIVRNRSKGVDMRRVFVHAAFTRHADGDAAPQAACVART